MVKGISDVDVEYYKLTGVEKFNNYGIRATIYDDVRQEVPLLDKILTMVDTKRDVVDKHNTNIPYMGGPVVEKILDTGTVQRDFDSLVEEFYKKFPMMKLAVEYYNSVGHYSRSDDAPVWIRDYIRTNN